MQDNIVIISNMDNNSSKHWIFIMIIKQSEKLN